MHLAMQLAGMMKRAPDSENVAMTAPVAAHVIGTIMIWIGVSVGLGALVVVDPEDEGEICVDIERESGR